MVINVRGTPSRFLGTSVTSNFSLIEAKQTIAIKKPREAPKPLNIVSNKLYYFCIFVIATPKTTQFVVISGKKTPKAL